MAILDLLDDAISVVVVVVLVVVVVMEDAVMGIGLVLDGGRDASEDPLTAGILKDIRDLKKEYPSMISKGKKKDMIRDTDLV